MTSAFLATPRRLQAHVGLTMLVALVLPFVVGDALAGEDLTVDGPPDWVTAAVLVAVAVLNVEISRALTGGLARAQQPHKALSAWAFATAMLLPAPWLLVVVPATYLHTRLRGMRVPLWKWVGSGAYLVVAAMAAAVVPRLLLGGQPNWMEGNGGDGLAVLTLAMLVFLAVETLLFCGSAWLNHADDEEWLRRQLTSPRYYLTEVGVLLIGALLASVWTAGAWFVLLMVPLYVLVQRAVLVEPLRENAAMADELAERNRQLVAVSEFKSDLMGMLAHEVGNPLTSVKGYAEVAGDALERRDVDGASRAVEVVARNAEQIEVVLQELVALVETNPGGLTARPEQTLLLPHLEAAAAARPPGRQPRVVCPADLAASIQPGHLDQVLANLLSNADKYAGGATLLEACADDVPGRPGVVRVSVVDDGPGVPEDFRDQLFRRRSRHAATAQTVSGRGIGLHISRALALANGGDLVLADCPEQHGGGSRFDLVLTAAPG